MALRPAFSAATWAANGVDLRDPLKPWLPDEDQAMALPWASVMVIIVLLKVALTCATPAEMFLRSRRRRRGAVSLAMAYFFTFFLPAIGRAGPLRVRALVWVRWPRTGRPLAVAQAAIAAEVHQPLDVHRDVPAQIALDPVVAVDDLAQARDLGIRQLVDPPAEGDLDLLQDLLRRSVGRCRRCS